MRINGFFVHKKPFLRTVHKAFCKKKTFWFVKMEIFADSEERHVQKKFLCVKNGFE